MEHETMTTKRWTIRSVHEDAIEVIRALSEKTGQSAGELVTKAIRYWAQTGPLGEISETPDAGEWNSMIAALHQRIHSNAQLLRSLNVRSAALRSTQARSDGGQE